MVVKEVKNVGFRKTWNGCIRHLPSKSGPLNNRVLHLPGFFICLILNKLEFNQWSKWTGE